MFYIFYSLTERERKERDHKKELLRLAQEHEKARELERVQRYHMPRDLGKGSTADYIEVDELEKVPQSEQKKWEKEQMASAVFSFGAKDKAAKDEYDLLIEDQIEFIQALQMPGNNIQIVLSFSVYIILYFLIFRYQREKRTTVD